MKNLQVICIKNAEFSLQVLGYCFDTDNHVTYVLSNSFDVHTITATNSTPAPFKTIDGASGKVIGFEYLVEARGILLVLEDGRIILVREDLIKLLYQHDCRISFACLSPGQDLLALADEKGFLQLMLTSEIEFEVIHKLNSLETNESLNKPVGVGWGSKETQFFGLDGRQTQKSSEPEKVPTEDELRESQEIETSEVFIKFKKSQERTFSIDWRGDGQFLATLSYLPDLNKHCLKVWNKKLELQYMSEKLIEIEQGILSYMPSGQFICCAQRRESKLSEITFFEKNGLVRHRFSLPSLLKNSHIHSLHWSPSSEVLALIVKQFVKTIAGKICAKNILLLYTMQNWHYYLKLSTYLDDDCDYLARWNPNISNQLHLLTTNGHYLEYDICSHVNYSEHRSTVYVIDGNKILITPLKSSVIPPPMFKYKLEVDDLIYKIAVSPWDEGCEVICILTMTSILLATSGPIPQKNPADFFHRRGPASSIQDDNSGNSDQLFLFNFGTIPDINLVQFVTLHRHLHSLMIEHKWWAAPKVIASRVRGSNCELISIKFDESLKVVIDVLKKFQNQQVIGISSNYYDPVDQQRYAHLILDSSRVIWDFDQKTCLKEEGSFCTDEKFLNGTIFEVSCASMYNPDCVSLSKSLCLRLGDRVVEANSCTSFKTTEDFLIYTTTDNLLKFLNIKSKEDELMSIDQIYSLPIENGAILIAACEKESKVVLQMPRGNLEVIHPRIFVLLAIINMNRTSCDYLSMIKLAKRHRVDMNFLVDLQSISSMSNFIHVVAEADPSLLCLVLTELDNYDTISGRYATIVKGLFFSRREPHKEKVNTFCKLVSQLDDPKYLHPRLQSLIKMEPKRTEEALEIISKLEAETPKTEAIKFMLYFMDIEELFKSALCTYNPEIMLMVAGSSNKDPKQYLSMIEELKTSDEVLELRHYKIDLYVKMYDRAFKNLFNHRLKLQKENLAEDKLTKLDSELIDLVTTKKVYKYAVGILEEEDGFEGLKAAIFHNYADYLLQKRHYEESGWAYSKAYFYSQQKKDFDLALLSYAFVNDWEKSIVLIARSSVEESIKIESLEKISKRLSESGESEKACLIHVGLRCQMHKEVISGLIDAHSWYLALFLTEEAEREKLQRLIILDIKKCIETFFRELRNQTQKAGSNLKRLETVFKENSNTPKESINYISDSVSTVDGSDLSSLSDGTSAISMTKSGVTSIKTRNTTKAPVVNKKRITLNKGSRYEDLGLIVELRQFLLDLPRIQREATALTGAAFEFCPFSYALSESNKISQRLQELLDQANKIVEKLWPPVNSTDTSLSVINRIERHFLSSGKSIYSGPLENVDFQICIKPDLPAGFTCFEI